MNELFDKLILRVVFTFFICIAFYLYKYAHGFLYPSAKSQLLKRYYPTKNAPDTIHLFSRLLGLGIIFSEFYFNISFGIGVAIIDFFIFATLVTFLYLLSIYIIESIVLYNFEYQDEIVKRKNYSYAIISFSHAIGLGIMFKNCLFAAKESVVIFFFLWLFSMVVLGFSTKTFNMVSKLSFNRLMVQKNLSIAFSYMGFYLGWSIILSSALKGEITEIKWYVIKVLLNLILSMIILPFFMYGLVFLYKIQEQITNKSDSDKTNANTEQDLGFGIYEGAIFFTSSFLTTVITSNLQFGNFYPIF